jgi:hypothetical protein
MISLRPKSPPSRSTGGLLVGTHAGAIEKHHVKLDSALLHEVQ